MSTMIAGHVLTRAEVRHLDSVLDYMRKHAGDSWASASTSPKGDGRAVSLWEIFSEHNAQNNAARRTIFRLGELNVLRACELDLTDGQVKWWPLLGRQSGDVASQEK